MEWNDFKLRKAGFLRGLDDLMPESEADLVRMLRKAMERVREISSKLIEASKSQYGAPSDIVDKMNECASVLLEAKKEIDRGKYADLPAIWLAVTTTNFVVDVARQKLNDTTNKEESSQ